MAMRWLEGFERAQDESLFARLYTVVQSDTVGTGIDGRNGAGNNHKTANSDGLIIRTPDLLDGAADQNTWVMGFAFFCGASFGLEAVPDAIPYVAFRNATGEQLRLEFIDAGVGTTNASKPGGLYYKLRLMRGVTEIATSTTTFVISQTETWQGWVYFEFKATIDTGVGGSIEVRWNKRKDVDQVVAWDASVSGINTANQGVAGADRVEISWDSGTDADDFSYDDIYILDSTGAKNNDFLGEIRIEELTVASDGDTTQWSLADAVNLEDAWNEPASSVSQTEDDKRVTSDTVGLIHLATLNDLQAIQSTTIHGVALRVYAKMESTGTRDVQLFYRKTTGTPAQVGGKVLTVNSTTMVGTNETLEDDPNTLTDWVHADVNGLQVGIELDA